MKVYHIADLDGLTEGIVAAESIGLAAQAFGISIRTMRELGWKPLKGGAAKRARDEPGRPYYRGIVGSAAPWTRDRSAARARAASAARRGGTSRSRPAFET